MDNKILIVLALLAVVGVGGYFYLQGQPQETVFQGTPQEGMSQEEIPSEEMPSEMTEKAEGYIDLSPAEAKQLIDDNPELIIIDVSPNYDQGHLPGAVNYYLGDGSLEEAIPELDKEAMYLVYCHVDSVAIQGAQMLVDAGFENVYRLEGNYAGWVNAGYEIER